MQLRGNHIKKNCNDNFVIKWNHITPVLAATAVVVGYDHGHILTKFLKIK